ncbi:MAG TPA: hypothetical protein VN257_10640 [Actinotalea sp.]|nr:hypothetical protein [Actinotalea sp.]
MNSTRLRRAGALSLLVVALGGLRTAGALELAPALFLGSDAARACGASRVHVECEVEYDSDLQGYGVSAARLSGLDQRCQGYDVVVSLNGPGGVPLAELSAAVEATRLRVVVPAGTPVPAERLTGVSVVLRGPEARPRG